MSQRLGPYKNQAALQAVVRTFTSMGECVQIEESYEPYQKKSRRYEGYIIRGVFS